MSDTMKSTGKTVDEAVREALLRMGLRREEVSVTVLQEARGGFLGMGRREAVVEVSKRSERSDRGRRRGGQGGRGRDEDGRRSTRGRGGDTDGEKRSRRSRGDGDEKQESRGRPDRSRRRKDDDDRRQDPRPQRDEAAAAGNDQDSGDAEGRKRRRRRRPRRRKSGAEVDQNVTAQQTDQPTQEMREAPQPEAAEAAPVAESVPERHEVAETPTASTAPAPDEARDDAPRESRSAAAAVVADVVAVNRVQPFGQEEASAPVELLGRAATSLMVKSGFQARVTVEEGDYHKIKMVVDDRSAGVLIGRQGSTVDAVEHLVERIATRTVGERVKLNLDINNYRLRREDGLLGRTRRAIQEARETGEPVFMEPAGGRDRRVVHLEVAEIDDLVTYTHMGEMGKQVVICRADQVPEEYRDPEVHGPASESTPTPTPAAPLVEANEDAATGADEDAEVEFAASTATDATDIITPETVAAAGDDVDVNDEEIERRSDV